jgi:hypothetical protein
VMLGRLRSPGRCSHRSHPPSGPGAVPWRRRPWQRAAARVGAGRRSHRSGDDGPAKAGCGRRRGGPVQSRGSGSSSRNVTPCSCARR